MARPASAPGADRRMGGIERGNETTKKIAERARSDDGPIDHQCSTRRLAQTRVSGIEVRVERPPAEAIISRRSDEDQRSTPARTGLAGANTGIIIMMLVALHQRSTDLSTKRKPSNDFPSPNINTTTDRRHKLSNSEGGVRHLSGPSPGYQSPTCATQASDQGHLT